MTIILSKVDLFLLVILEIFFPCGSIRSSQTLWSFNSSTDLKKKKQGDLRPGSDVGMAEGREVSRWRWLSGWPKGRGEGPYEVKRAENRPLPASHSPRSPAEAF